MVNTENKEGNVVIRNMIISILTTVIGAALIYFLGFNNKKPGVTKLEREEATVNAWRSYVTVENIYTKNDATLIRDFSLGRKELGEYLDETLKESETIKNSLTEFIALDEIDKDLVSLFKRRKANEELMIAKYVKMAKRADEMVNSKRFEEMTDQQIYDTILIEDKEFAEQMKGMIQRSLTDIEDLSKTLSDRYDQSFSMDDFLVIQVYKHGKDLFKLIDSTSTSIVPPPPNNTAGTNTGQPADPLTASHEYLVGKWNSNGTIMTLNTDGKCSWLNPSGNTETKGTWQFKNDRVIMNLKEPKTGKKMVWTFDLSDITANAFNLKLSGDVSNPSYRMTRM